MALKKVQNTEEFGICIKSQDAVVEFQNQKCFDLCGDQLNKKCEKGCMLRYAKSKADAAFDHSYKIIKNIESDGVLVDAIMINDGQNLTTLLLEKNLAVEEQMIQISKFKLSTSEMNVMEKYLLGISNHEISKQLFISKATLRTHLNNIYKKIPDSYKQEIIAAHKSRS